MRKILSSSNALMAVVLALLMAIALWTVFGSEEDLRATGTDQEQSSGQARTARGGGPVAEPSQAGDEAPNELETPESEESEAGEPDEPELERPMADEAEAQAPRLEKPRFGPEQLEQPQLEQSEAEAPAPSQRSGESNDEQPTDDQQAQTGDEVDQEAAYRTDEAPEADVIGVQPAEPGRSRGGVGEPREGGGPLDEQEGEASEAQADEQRDEREEAVGEHIEGEQVDDQEGEEAGAGSQASGVDREAAPGEEELQQALDEQAPGGQQAPAPPPSEESEADESGIERPSLRSAPRPSRPGEE